MTAPCLPGTCSGRGHLSPGQAGGGPAWSKGLGRGLDQQTVPHPCKSLQMGLENQESPKQRAGVSLHCCLVPGKPTLHRMIPVMASSKPASIPIPALRFQSILVSRRSGEGRRNRGQGQNKTCTNLMARKASLYARSASWGSRAENRYLAKVCMGTLSRWMTSPKPLKGPPRQKQSPSAIISTAGSVAGVCTTSKLGESAQQLPGALLKLDPEQRAVLSFSKNPFRSKSLRN